MAKKNNGENQGRDALYPAQVKLHARKEFYEPGKPYLWIQTFGWAVVGFFVKHVPPFHIQVAHANHFRNAGKDYGRLAREGAGDDCDWRYEGEALLNVLHVIRPIEYHGQVPRPKEGDPDHGADDRVS